MPLSTSKAGGSETTEAGALRAPVSSTLIDLRAHAETSSPLRSDTPRQILAESFSALHKTVFVSVLGWTFDGVWIRHAS